MKKLLFFLCLLSAISFSQETTNSSKKVLEKETFVEDAEKGKKILNEMKKDLNESLELKVLRSGDDLESRLSAAEEAFKTGEDRLDFIRNEESEIIKLGKEIGKENKEKFLGQQFDEVHREFKNSKEKAEALIAENKKLKEYINKLDNMENQIK